MSGPVLDDPEPPGELGSDDVVATMTAHRPEIWACYDQARRRDRSLEGRVVVHFRVAPDGKVEDVGRHEDTTLPDPDAVRCVIGKVAAAEFPRSSMGRTVRRFPFGFFPD